MKLIKKIVALGLSIALLLPSVNVHALDDNIESVNEQIINTVESNITYSDDGIVIDSDEQLINELRAIDIDALRSELIELGANQESVDTFNEDTIFMLLKDSIEDINNKVEQNILEITENNDIVDTTDDEFYVQGGSTYSVRYSWGIRHYKSTASANYFTYTLAKHSNNIALTSGTSLIFAPYGIPAGVLGLVSAWYFNGVVNKVNYYNNKNNRGIILDINYWLTYSVRNQ